MIYDRQKDLLERAVRFNKLMSDKPDNKTFRYNYGCSHTPNEDLNMLEYVTDLKRMLEYEISHVQYNYKKTWDAFEIILTVEKRRDYET